MSDPVQRAVTDTLERARKIGPELVALRRRLHEVPELGLELPKTQALVLEALEGLDLEVTTGTGLSSVVAVLRGGAGAGPVVLLRGDMDALPVQEKVDLPYASTHPGLMHACGHDLHVAGLVGAARVLNDQRAGLAGDVVFMFQPGEEGVGGADIMLGEGVLDAAGRPVDAAYCLHVIAIDPCGQWSGRPGMLMAAADTFRVRVVGSGGHGSEPQRARDPLPAACEMVLALQTRVTRAFGAFEPVVVTVGRLEAGTVSNVIADDARFEATVRTFTPEARDRIEAVLTSLVEGVATAHGLTVELEYERGYPPTVNDEEEFTFVRDTVVDMFGDDHFGLIPHPEPGAEDFSFVLEKVPGAYVFLGACPTDPAKAADNHSPRAVFDDAVLPDAAALLAELAVRRIARR